MSMSIRRGLVLVLLSFCASGQKLLADEVVVGQRVFVTSLKEYGTVTAVTTTHGDGGLCREVLLDKFSSSGSSIMFDPSHLIPAGPDAQPSPGRAAQPDSSSAYPYGIGPDTVLVPEHRSKFLQAGRHACLSIPTHPFRCARR